MTSLSWKINRLRTMPLREIIHRNGVMLKQHWEKKRIAQGWSPLPQSTVSPKIAFFSPDANWLGAWQKHCQLDIDGLDLLLDGSIDFFGHSRLDVGMPVQWLQDPLTGTVIGSDTYGKWLDYRDEALVGNVKILWELGRHQHLVPLAVAYAVSGDTRYRDCIANQIEGWIQQNPFGCGIHWCSSLELALRLISWALVHSLLVLRDGPGGLFKVISEPELLGRSIYQQAFFINGYLSRYTSANNHLIGELTGLWVACQVFDLGAKGTQWAGKAQSELERETVRQIFDDGVDREQALYYHLWVLEYLLFAWQVGVRTDQPFSISFRDRIIKMALFLHSIIPEGGQAPDIGDADDGFVARFGALWPKDPYGDVLNAVGNVFNIKELCTGNILPDKAFWYGAINDECDTLSATEYQPPQVVNYPLIYPSGGYGLLKADRTHLLFDAGSLGYPSIAAHGHSDALSFCLAIGKDWWLIDPGTYSYHTDIEWRNYFRGTSAHNTLTVDGQNQSQIGGSFLWLKHAHATIKGYGNDSSGCQWIEGEHDGYKRMGVHHRRKIRFCNNGREIYIDDIVEGSGNHLLVLYLHFHSDITLNKLDETNWQAERTNIDSIMNIEVDKACEWQAVRGNTQPILGWHSEMLGKKEATFTLYGQYEGVLPIRLLTKLLIQD